MARTNLKGTQVLDGSVSRADLNTTVSGSAVITKIITTNGVAMTAYTGADSGTGDVTVAADLSFLDTKYPSITTSRTQNQVLAAPASGNGVASFRALVAGDIPVIGISGVTGLQTNLDNKWALGGNSLSNTGVIGSSTDQNIQLVRNSVAGLTLKVDGITDVKKLAVGRISGYGGNSWDSLAVFGGNVTIGGKDSATQGSYDLNLVAYTTNDNPGNATRKARIKFGYYDAANFVDKFKRTIEYWRTNDAIVIGSHSTLITDTATTSPIEGNSVYFGSDGSVGIASSALTASSLKISKIITGDGQDSGYGILNNGVVQSDITVTAYYNNTFASTVASGSAYTIPAIIHYSARQLAFGNNSSVSNQFAFYADSTLTGATNNYSFYGALAAGGGRWNVYMAGSANNYFNGNVWIGTNTGNYKLDVNGTGHFSQDVTFEANAVLSAAPTSGSHLVNKTYADTKLSGTGTTNYLAKYTGSGTLGNSSIYDNGGLVGIGTTSPSARLSLGTFWSTGAETVGINLREGSLAGELPAYGIGFGPASSEGYVTYRSGTSSNSLFGHKFFVNNTEVMRVRGDGNLGIGTNSPIYRLDVNGNARLTSNLIISGSISNGNTIAYFDNNNTNAGQSFGLLVDAGTSTSDYVLKLRNASSTEMLIFNGAGSLGIGGSGTLITGSTLTLAKSFSSSTSYGIYSYGQITSSNTGNAYYYRSLANTQAASFTVGSIAHYSVAQGTIGANSSVTNQYGFLVESTMTGANNNYGFYGTLPNGNWNLYMSGTGSNFLNGRLGIGSNILVDRNLQLVLPITGGTTAYGMISNGQVQSGVTFNAYQYFSQANAAADVTLTNFSHYTAVYGSINGSITNQNGFYVPSLIGATNNYAFRGGVTNATGAWNLYMDGSANNYLGGKIGVGTLSLADKNFALDLPLSSSSPYSFINTGTVQTNASNVFMNYSQANVATGANASSLYHFVSSQAALSGTIGNQYGFFASSALTGGTNNYGFYGNLPAGAGLWNLYMNSNANNYIGGRLGIGSTSLSNVSLKVTKNISGSGTSIGIWSDGQIQSDVSTVYYFRSSSNTQNAFFTISDIYHYGVVQGVFGANSIVNNQIGFYVGNLTGGNTNIAIRTQVTAGFNKWNIYIDGTANNYLAGNLWIGTNTGGFKLDVNGNARFTQEVQFNNYAICDAAPTDASHLTNKAYVDSLSSIKRGESVKTIALTNISLSGTQTINGVSLIAGDLILVAGQTSSSQNGVYTVTAGTWSRSSNNDSENEIKGAYHLITAGSYANQRYINTNSSSITLGTTAITYALDFGAETDPVWNAYKTLYDISPTRISQWNSAYSIASSLTTTNALAEGGSNLYFTTSRVLATALTGYLVGANTSLSATDTVLQAFQKVQGQLNNRLLIGGNIMGFAITMGTIDNFDLSLKRYNSTHLTLQNGVSKFFFDVDIVGKIKLNGSTGSDHQFIKYNGSSNEWAYLNTGELQDKNNIVMLEDIAGERGFQLFSDSAKTYADAFVFTNSIAGIALGIHGYSTDSSDIIQEFGLQLDVDGYLYHKRLDGVRSRIATVDMINGSGGGNWNGGFVSNSVEMPIDKYILWDTAGNNLNPSSIGFRKMPLTSPVEKALQIYSNANMYINAAGELNITSNRLLFTKDLYPVEIDFSGAYSLPDGHYARFLVSSTTGGIKKLTIISD